MKLPNEYLLLIDASSFIHRHFHAAARTERRSDGMPVHALHGLAWSLMKMVMRAQFTTLETNPSHVLMVMDTRGATFRHGIYPDYKGQRSPYPDDLEVQLPFMVPMAEHFGIPHLGVPQYEADDIIATYARMAEREGMFCVIASSDKDLMQLLSETTLMYDPKKDEGDQYRHHLLTVDDCVETWGVQPWQMVDLQAITGDTVDNVPGAAGIGKVGAAKLLTEFGTLDAILENIDFIEKAGLRKKIEESQDAMLVSRELVTLADNVPVPYEIKDLRWRTPNYDALGAWLREMGFANLARRIGK